MGYEVNGTYIFVSSGSPTTKQRYRGNASKTRHNVLNSAFGTCFERNHERSKARKVEKSEGLAGEGGNTNIR